MNKDKPIEEQIDIDEVTGKVARKGEEVDFRAWLQHIVTRVLPAERDDIEGQYERYFKGRISRGIDVENYKCTRGAFENFLFGIWDCCQQVYKKRGDMAKLPRLTDFIKPGEAAKSLIGGMLGMFWEREFCKLISKYRPVHWFQKWEPIGAPGLGGGGDIIEWRINLPDVMFMDTFNRWVFAEVKHISLASDGWLQKEDWERIQKHLLPKLPPIPYLFVVHNHSRLGKWAIKSEVKDWFMAGFRVLGEPKPDERRLETRWGKEKLTTVCYWGKEQFKCLAKEKSLEYITLEEYNKCLDQFIQTGDLRDAIDDKIEERLRHATQS